MFVRKSRVRGHMDVRPQEPLGELEREVEGLRRDLEEAREQQSATSEVLSVLGRSKSDLKPLFETVVENASRLCRADAGRIYIADRPRFYRPEVASGGSSHYRQLLARSPIAPGNDTLVGKVALEHVTIHIPDVVADPDYHWPESQRAGGQRTMLGVPSQRRAGHRLHLATALESIRSPGGSMVTTSHQALDAAIPNVDLIEAVVARTSNSRFRAMELQALTPSSKRRSTLEVEEC